MLSGKQEAVPGPPCSGQTFKRFLLPVIFLLTTTILPGTSELLAQEYHSTRSIVVEDLIEKIARDADEELDYQTLFDDLFGYLESPLNINTATRQELEKLHLLTDFQIISLQAYILENGALLSVYELPMVYGFSESLARALEPLIVCGPPHRALPGKPRSSHQLLMFGSTVLEEQKGYSDISDSALAASPNSRYTGNRFRLMTRYRYRLGDRIEVGYKGDKDAGEPLLRGKNRQGFDFNSAYFQVRDVWKFSRIIAGDYQVRAGQGLSVWSGLAFGKSPDIINIRRRGDALTPYTSVEENRFMRGISATADLGSLGITGFVSHKKIDANIFQDTLSGNQMFSSFQTSGYHRTPGEFGDKDAVRETVAGGTAVWEAGRLRLGASFLHYFYDAEYNKNYGDPILSSGVRSNSNFGVDYTVGLDRFSFFGEVAYCINPAEKNHKDRLGILNGASFRLHPQVYMSVLQRYMGAGYFARYGNAFRENSQNTNENGIYMGVEILPIPRWKLTAYLDAYRFPFLAELLADYHSGYDYHLQLEYTDRDRLSGYMRYRYKNKPGQVNPGSSTLPSAAAPVASQLRFHISYQLAGSLTFQDRLEFSRYHRNGYENGWLAYHDIIYKPEAFPLSFSFRYAMFDTESHNTRIYTYEHDILYQFAIPSWNGRGIRTYLNSRWQIGEHADLWLKYALSWYPDRDVIGSGLNSIQGNHRQDIKLQLRLRF